MFKEITFNRRRFLGTAATVMAAPQLAMIGCAKEQSSKAGSADATTSPGSVSGAPSRLPRRCWLR
jgi:nitrous oxide reductase